MAYPRWVCRFGGDSSAVHLMRALRLGVSSLDFLSFAAVPLILAAATFLPAYPVAAVNPVDALRVE